MRDYMKFRDMDLLITRGVMERLHSIPERARQLGMTVNGVAFKLFMTEQELMGWTELKTVPSLEEYLLLAEVLQWDLSTDPNYHYVNSTYSREYLLNHLEACLQDGGMTASEYQGLKDYLTGKNECFDYAYMLMKISRHEKAVGLEDPLPVED